MSAMTILVAEPDSLVRTPLAIYLRDCGYTVVEASDGQETIALLQRETPCIDILLAAVNLGNEPNGFAVSQWVRKHRANVKVLLAGSVEKAADAAGELCNEGPLLSRPYDPQTVVDRIKRLLASRASVQGETLILRPTATTGAMRSGS